MDILTPVVFWIIGILIGLLIGLLIGKFVADVHWSQNAKGPQRNLYNGRFYKVVELDNLDSWQLLRIHNKSK